MSAEEHACVKLFRLDVTSFLAVSGPSTISGQNPQCFVETGSVSKLCYLPSNTGPESRLLFSRSSFTEVNELYKICFSTDASPQLLTSFTADQLKKIGKGNLNLTAGEAFWFEGAKKGSKVHGWIVKPNKYRDSDANATYPALL